MKKQAGFIVLMGLVLTGCVSTGGDHVYHGETGRRDGRTVRLPVLGETSTLDDYRRYAALNNPGLEAAYNQWQAALARIPQARTLPEPRLSYGYFIEEVETRVGPQRHKFEVSQTLPWFGTLGLKDDEATEAAAAAHYRYQQAKLKLFYEVEKHVYEYYFLGRSIAVTEHNMALLEELEAMARAKFETNTAKHNSVIKVQMELARLRDRLVTLKDFERPLKAKLNALLNRRPQSTLSWPKEIPDINDLPVEDELVASLRTTSPVLKSLERLVAKETAGVKLAGKRYYPDIMIGASMIETGDAAVSTVEDSGKDPIVGMVGISLPIWFGAYRAKVREAEAKEAAARQRLEDEENNLVAEAQMAFYRFRDAARKITLYGEQLVPKAREALAVNRQTFAADKTSVLDVIDTERTLLEFELAYERARVDRALNYAHLTLLIGKALSTGAGMATETPGPVERQAVCPVMGHAINEALFVERDGKRIYMCCAGCTEKIKANFDKYVKQLEAEGVVLNVVPDREEDGRTQRGPR